MTPRFTSGPVQVRVPATSANLGPGFDALGLALSLYDDLVASVGAPGLAITVTGEGADVARDESHLVVSAMRATFDCLGGQPGGLALTCTNRIPHGRGLGSSAAAIVAGVVLARGLVVGGADELPDADALDLAARIEGHPDNVAPCLLGGLTVAWADDERSHAVRRDCDPAITPVVFIPPFQSSTKQARGLLPLSVPHSDAAFTAGRAALLVAAVTGSPEALFAATEDRLHQQFRVSAMPESGDLVAALRASGHAAVISGAGPTVLVLTRDEVEVQQVRACVPMDWECERLSIDEQGARIVASA